MQARTLRHHLGFLATVIYLLLPIVVMGQTLRVQANDRDIGIPLEGVRVGAAGATDHILTDALGTGELILGETERLLLERGRLVIDFTLIGYEPLRTLVRNAEETVVGQMALQGLLTAQELVVEAQALGRTDEQLGVSVTVERDLIKSTAMIGPIEDVMSTVKLLPGVGYSGSFGNRLTIRGGEPDGLTHVVDGAVIRYPYHWGGGFSIFNPHMIESVRLSAGIFAVRYGQATSGLMEVNSITPNQGFRGSFAQSTSTFEGYLQIPLGSAQRAGILIGTRLTNYDLVVAMTGSFLRDQGLEFSRVPYIYDGYFRGYYRPDARNELWLNGFIGTDGIGLKAAIPNQDTTRTIVNSFDFSWINHDTFWHLGYKRLIGDRLFLNSLVGYEYGNAVIDAKLFERGTRAYSQSFIDRFGATYNLKSGDTFSVDTASEFKNTARFHFVQGRFDADYELLERGTVQAGIGGFLTVNQFAAEGFVWGFVPGATGQPPEYRRLVYSDAAPENRVITTFGYLNYLRPLLREVLELEVGLRVDHGILTGNGFFINTVPAPGPRALLRYSPAPPAGLESLVLTLGTGLFSKVPTDASDLSPERIGGAIQLPVPQNAMVVGGSELRFPSGIRFKLEGYYKYLFDRYYVNQITTSQTATDRTVQFRIHNDGIGHAAGFDFLLDRRSSRRWDGFLSYSFIFARYLNPVAGTAATGNAPRGHWYYPSFHRFHTANLVLNYKPTDWFTLTQSVTFASGNPRRRFGQTTQTASPVRGPDNSLTIAEFYTRPSFYDDELRNGWVLPVDLRAAFHWYRRGTKRANEFYLGVEDILSPLLARYGPNATATTTNRFTGEDTPSPQQSFAFPIVSVGYRLSY